MVFQKTALYSECSFEASNSASNRFRSSSFLFRSSSLSLSLLLTLGNSVPVSCRLKVVICKGANSTVGLCQLLEDTSSEIVLSRVCSSSFIVTVVFNFVQRDCPPRSATVEFCILSLEGF